MTSSPIARRQFLLTGNDRTAFLQGLLTQDITKLNEDKIQFAALLSPQGKILNDMFLTPVENGIILDTQSAFADALLKRLNMYKLRAKVTIEPLAADAPMLANLPPLPDPRHPDLTSYSPFTTHYSPLSLGIPELGRDFAPDEVTPLDAGYDLLNAVSFTKGCYVGQEITARMHYKNIARRAFYILTHNGQPAPTLALLKFEDVAAADHQVTRGDVTYRAQLPAWSQPKFAQFLQNSKNQ